MGRIFFLILSAMSVIFRVCMEDTRFVASSRASCSAACFFCAAVFLSICFFSASVM